MPTRSCKNIGDRESINPRINKILSKGELINKPKVDKKIFDYNPTNNEEIAKESWINFTTDVMFTAPMQDWGNLMSTVDSEAYLYIWDHHPIINGTTKFKAFHAAEVPYVFGGMDAFNIDFTEEDIVLSNTMMDIWTNFAKTGNPSLPGRLVWPPFEITGQKYVSLGLVIEEKQNLRSEKVALINTAFNNSRIDFN